jgi:hypothetical protein
VVISGNTLGHGGTGIVVESDDFINSDANNSKIIANNVFDNSGVVDLTNSHPNLQFENAGILVCSNNNLVLGNEVNGSAAGAIFVDTCFNKTFGSTGNTIKVNDIDEACAGVWQRTTGNIVNSNEFRNTVHVLQSGTTCSTTLAPLSLVQGGSSVNTRRRGPQ